MLTSLSYLAKFIGTSQGKSSPAHTLSQSIDYGQSAHDEFEYSAKSPALGSEAYFAESENENMVAGWSSEADDCGLLRTRDECRFGCT